MAYWLGNIQKIMVMYEQLGAACDRTSTLPPELRSNEVMMTIRSGLNYRIYLYMFGYPSHKCKLTRDVDRNNTFMKIIKKKTLLSHQIKYKIIQNHYSVKWLMLHSFHTLRMR